MNPIMMLTLLVSAWAAFAWSANRRWQLLKVGRSEDRTDHIGKRLKLVYEFAVVQKKMNYYPLAGIAHKAIFVGFLVLLLTSLLNLFFRNEVASLWLAGGTIFIFGGLLVFDTWRIVRSGQYTADDYVPAAVNIYLDLLNLFMAILSLLGGGRRRS